MTDDSSKVARLEARLDSLDGRMDRFDLGCTACRLQNGTGFDHVYKKVDALSERLRSVEIRVAFFAGGAALVGAVGGAIFSKFLGG